MNNLAPMRNCPGVQGRLNQTPGYDIRQIFFGTTSLRLFENAHHQLCKKVLVARKGQFTLKFCCVKFSFEAYGNWAKKLHERNIGALHVL